MASIFLPDGESFSIHIRKLFFMPNFDTMEGIIKCLLMAAILKEERTLGHLAKDR